MTTNEEPRIVLGTTPSITFSITSTLKDYLVKRNPQSSFYSDLDLTVNGNVSSTFSALDCSNIGLITVRGADGGNNGQFAIQVSNDMLNWVTTSSSITQGVSTALETSLTNQAFRAYRLITTAHTSVGTRVLDVHWSAN